MTGALSHLGKTVYYVLVRNHTEGFELYKRLKNRNLDVRVAPAPHGVQACCGMALLSEDSQIDHVRSAIAEQDVPIEGIVKVDNALNPMRDTFC